MILRATTKGFAFLFRNIIADMFYTPVWWYSQGLIEVARGLGNEALDYASSLSLKILFRNLLTPMFGDYSRSGRIISFFVRIAQFGVKLVMMLIWLLVLVVVLLLWLVLPVFVFYQILYHLIPILPSLSRLYG